MRGQGLLFALCALIGILAGFRSFFAVLFAAFAVCLLAQIKRLSVVLIVFSVCLLFFFRTTIDIVINQSQLSGEEQFFAGKIIATPEIDGDRLSVPLKLISAEKIQVRYRIKTKEEKELLYRLKPGMTCAFSGRLEVPDVKRNPGGFDYQAYLYHNRIHWIVHPDALDRCDDRSLTFVDRLKRYRQTGMQFVDAIFMPEVSGIAKALLFGDQHGIHEHVLEAYQKFGLVHVLVVSGLHVGVVTAFLFWILIRIGLTRERAMDIILVLLPIYVLLTGAAPSVLRAAIMAAAVIIGFRLRVRLHPLDSICLAFLLLLFFDPNFLYHVGFQLSFLISFALIVSAGAGTASIQSGFMRIVAISLIAQLVSLPLLVYYFYQFSVWSLLVNVLFVPLFTTVIMPLSFLGFFLSLLIPFAGAPLVFLFETIVLFVHSTLLTFEKWPLANFVVGKPAPFYVFVYYMAVIYGLIQMEAKKWRPKAALTSFLPLASLLFIQLLYPYVNPYGHVTVLDVGQGDSVLIELPYRKGVYLIDTGGIVSFREEEWQKRTEEFDVGEEIVLQALKEKGIRKIDKLILTHGDYDHIGGTETLIEEMNIGELLYGTSNTYDDLELALLNKAAQAGIKVTFVEAGMGWREGGARFFVLNPQTVSQSGNDRSIVLYTEMGGLSWLFTGDLEQEGERRLLSTYLHLKADVLKVAHHGSKTSTSQPFLDRIQPKVAIISAGKNNRFGHPHREVVERLEKRGVVVYRTDESGAISFRYRKESGYFDPMIH